MTAAASRIVDSPVGRLWLAATDAGLTHLLFASEMKNPPSPEAGGEESARILLEAERQLTEYFEKKRKAFEIPLALEGTEFQLEVWNALKAIPYGRTVSYGELAERLGKPDAIRAVGAANGANPIAIMVPCHRVIGADGKLTGYGGGLYIKRRLLEMEQGIRSWL
jgi:methylated-DNA-[protein]-cysteine S-methyltransferase